MRRSLPVGLFLLLSLSALQGCASDIEDSDSSHAALTQNGGSELQWKENLDSVGGDVVGIQAENGGWRTLSERGLFTFATRRLAQPVDRVWATASGDIPDQSEMAIEVRNRSVGGGWSEWRVATSQEPAVFPAAGSEVQVRAVLTANPNKQSPVLRTLSLRASPSAASAPMSEAPLAPLTYRVYATREGLVGGTTANGHVIKSRDHFVALPTRRALASNGGREYTVTLRYNGHTVTEPVWDVGPWNTKDDYWNPSATREMWRDLPQGKPESQAAYQNGYNGGKDQFGRTVANPAGIDLADGTFWDSLGMSDNDWVDVTYNWTSGGGSTWEAIVDDATAGRFHASANWGTSTYSSQRYGTGYRFATPEAVSDPAWFAVDVPAAGNYEAFVYYPADPGYNSQTPFLVQATDGVRTVKVDQRQGGGQWVSLGVFPIAAGDHDVVGVSRWTTTTGYVIADAVKLVRR
ncbi:hypothetical protein LVJ94_28645 [Pendulispora rubella]|uniref:Golvesin/Xly CBD-like domain-containing protein n=1 Tax=Pendulispora rubella TaxID=2741070 RepID=A0ABZ2KQE5_9BACT